MVGLKRHIKNANDSSNPGLPRVAFKMATGTGKTVVMAMLIASQTLNKLANPQDARFTDSFVLVAPGITIRDRLRVLLPHDPSNYYRERDLVPNELMQSLGQSRIVVLNFHAFQAKELGEASRLAKVILQAGKEFTETPEQVVKRVCRNQEIKKISLSLMMRLTIATSGNLRLMMRSCPLKKKKALLKTIKRQKFGFLELNI